MPRIRWTKTLPGISPYGEIVEGREIDLCDPDQVATVTQAGLAEVLSPCNSVLVTKDGVTELVMVPPPAGWKCPPEWLPPSPKQVVPNPQSLEVAEEPKRKGK